MTDCDITSLWKEMETPSFTSTNLNALNAIDEPLDNAFCNVDFGGESFFGFCPIDELSNDFLGIEPLIDKYDIPNTLDLMENNNENRCEHMEKEEEEEEEEEYDTALDVLRCEEEFSEGGRPDVMPIEKKIESDIKKDSFLAGIRLNSWYRLRRIEQKTDVKYYNASTGVVKTIASSSSSSKDSSEMTAQLMARTDTKIRNRRGNTLKKVKSEEPSKAAIEKRKRIRKKNATRIQYLKGISPGRNLCSMPYGKAVSYLESISPRLMDDLALPRFVNTCLFRKRGASEIETIKLF